MNLKEQNLIKIKSLQQKHANQIEKVTGNWHPKWKWMWEALRDNYAEVKLLYWAVSRPLDGMPDNMKVWLVQVEGKHLYWLAAPAENHEYAKFGEGLEQLFVD